MNMRDFAANYNTSIVILKIYEHIYEQEYLQTSTV